MKLAALATAAAVALTGLAAPVAAQRTVTTVHRTHGLLHRAPHHKVKVCQYRTVARHRVKKCYYR